MRARRRARRSAPSNLVGPSRARPLDPIALKEARRVSACERTEHAEMRGGGGDKEGEESVSLGLDREE